MGQWVSEVFQCSSCGYVEESLIQREHRDFHLDCPDCGELETLRRVISCVNVRTEKLSETFVDGTKRAGWDKMREASMLNKEKARARGIGDLKAEKQVKEAQKQLNTFKT